MTIPTLDKQKCAQRSRIAARRDNVNAYSFAVIDLGRHPHLSTVKERAEAELAEQFPEGVYTHYMEAANDNFIPDRFMFLHSSTLKNAAEDAQNGIAFMNSHRTGGLSHPAELPMGHSFLGHYAAQDNGDGRISHHTIMGIYMQPGLFPMGQNGPSTDDLHAMIEGKTVRDVSVGLYGGFQQCDVCGEDIFSIDPDTGSYVCKHYPGTTYAMTTQEQRAQEARGVAGGVASYSLVNARCGEVSSVYDGAVPGAGFMKVQNLLRSSALSSDTLHQLQRAYAPFLTKGELSKMDNDGIIAAIQRGFESLASKIGLHSQSPEVLPAANVPPLKPGFAPATSELEERTKRLEEELAAHKEEANKAKVRLYMSQFKLEPAQFEAHVKLRAADPATYDTLMDTQKPLAHLAPANYVSGEAAAQATGNSEQEIVNLRSRVRELCGRN